jgi:hypothetical protein
MRPPGASLGMFSGEAEAFENSLTLWYFGIKNGSFRIRVLREDCNIVRGGWRQVSVPKRRSGSMVL